MVALPEIRLEDFEALLQSPEFLRSIERPRRPAIGFREVLTDAARAAFFDVLRTSSPPPQLLEVAYRYDEYRDDFVFRADFVGPRCDRHWAVTAHALSESPRVVNLALGGFSAHCQALYREMIHREQERAAALARAERATAPPVYSIGVDMAREGADAITLVIEQYGAAPHGRVDGLSQRGIIGVLERELLALGLLERIEPYVNEAEARGLKLLKEWLSPAQLRQFEADGHFEVTGCHSARRYRIRNAATFNVELLDKAGAGIGRYCFVPEGNLVRGDQLLAQKVALETNERAALKVANVDHGYMRIEVNPELTRNWFSRLFEMAAT